MKEEIDLMLQLELRFEGRLWIAKDMTGHLSGKNSNENQGQTERTGL